MSYFMIRSAAGYLQSGSLVAVAAPAADAVRRESGRAAHLPAVCCDVGGRRWHRGHPGRAGLGNPVLRPVHPVPGGGQPVRGPHDHGLHHGDTGPSPRRCGCENYGGAWQAHVYQPGPGLGRPDQPVFIVIVILAVATVPLLLRCPTLPNLTVIPIKNNLLIARLSICILN